MVNSVVRSRKYLKCSQAIIQGNNYGNLIFASRNLGMGSKIEHNIIEAITITCCEY